MLLKININQFARLYPQIRFNNPINVKGKVLSDRILKIYNVHQKE